MDPKGSKEVPVLLLLCNTNQGSGIVFFCLGRLTGGKPGCSYVREKADMAVTGKTTYYVSNSVNLCSMFYAVSYLPCPTQEWSSVSLFWAMSHPFLMLFEMKLSSSGPGPGRVKVRFGPELCNIFGFHHHCHPLTRNFFLALEGLDKSDVRWT